MKVLTVIDEFTHEALAIVSARSLTASAVKGVLSKLFASRGKPKTIRCDNGPEFIAFELTELLEAQGATTHHIDPGKPWQNSFAESQRAGARRVSEHERVLDYRACPHGTACTMRFGHTLATAPRWPSTGPSKAKFRRLPTTTSSDCPACFWTSVSHMS